MNIYTFSKVKLLTGAGLLKSLISPINCRRHLPNIDKGLLSLASCYVLQRRTMLEGIQLDKEKIIKEWEEKVDLEKLSHEHRVIHNAHINALKAGKDAYHDPFTGFEVFTMLAHLKRGYCCGNACRHCPFQQVMVDPRYKNLKKFNTSFYA